MGNYKPIFENRIKSLKLIKLRDDKNEMINKTNLKLTQYSNVIIMPLTFDMEEVALSVKLMFGLFQYHKFIKSYFFPKKFNYRRTLIPSPMKKEIIDGEAIKNKLKETLPYLAKFSNCKIINKKNTLIDYSTILNEIMYNDNKSLSKAAVMSKVELLLPEFLTYVLFDSGNINIESYIHTLGLQIFANSEPRNFNQNYGFNRFIIPYRIRSTNKSICKTNILDSSSNLNRNIKTDINSIYDVSIFRFLMRCYGRDYYEKSYELYNDWIEQFIQFNPVFFFYNDSVGFVFDMKELQMLKKNYNTVLNILRERLNFIIKINSCEFRDSDQLNKALIELEPEDVKVSIKEQGKDTPEIKVRDTELNLLKEQKSQIKTLLNNVNLDGTNINPKLKMQLIDSDDEVNEDNYDIIKEDEEFENDEEYNDLEDDEENDVDFEEDEEKIKEQQEEAKEKVEEINEDELKDLVKTIEKNTKPKRTPKQEKRIKLISEKYKSVKLNDGRTLGEILEDTKTTVIDNKIKKVPVRNERILKTTTMDFEKSYVEKTMQQDILKTIKSFSDNKELNLHIMSVEYEDTTDQFTDKYTYVVKFEDDNQKRHTLKFDMPKVNDDGIIKINGNEKILRKQLIFLPVVKNTPNTVWLTSYLNRVIIERHGLVHNRATHILKRLLIEELKTSPQVDIKYGNFSKDNKDYLTTIEYDDLSERYLSIDIKPKSSQRVKFFFSIKKAIEEIKSINPKTKYTKDYLDRNPKILLLGYDFGAKKEITVDIESADSSISEIVLDYITSAHIITDLENIVKSTKVPNRKTYLKINLQSKEIPLIVFLSAIFGFQNVINKAGMKVQFSEKPIRNDRRNVIRFKDGYLYYDEYPNYLSFLLNGLYYLPTEDYEIVELESQMIYLDYLFSKFKSRHVIKGWYSFKDLFLDPITISILKDLSLPTDFLELFLYAASLLNDNEFLHEGDKDNYRLRGYEVMVECLYTALASQYISVRQRKKSTFSIPQDVILNKLHKSQILANKDTLNPMQEAKDKGIVTMKGPSGTNLKQAYTMTKRAYDKKSLTIFAMSSVDNSNVGVIKQLVMDANIKSTRGYLKTDNVPEETNFSQLYSFEEGVVPYIGCDDPSRVGFATIQTSHIVASHSSTPPIVRTGVETVLGYKIPETFVKRAKKDGIVSEVDEKNKKIYIVYKDGTKDVFSFGMQLTRNSNFFIENDLKCRFKKGDKIEEDDIIIYNGDWFVDEGDKVVYKSGPLGRIIFLETESTEEDGSVIFEDFAKRMETGVVKRKSIVIRPGTFIHNYAKPGDHIMIGQPLMSFEETSENETAKVMDMFGLDESFADDLLRKTPKANATGIIRDMKVYWTVPPNTMHPTLEKLINSYISDIKKDVGENEKFTGKKDSNRFKASITIPIKNRINGEAIPEEGGVLIEYYISHDSGMAGGDKLSYNSALKSVVSKVVPKKFQAYTESGIPIDCIIGLLSSQARMINSIYKSGILGAYLYRNSIRIGTNYFKSIGTKLKTNNLMKK